MSRSAARSIAASIAAAVSSKVLSSTVHPSAGPTVTDSGRWAGVAGKSAADEDAGNEGRRQGVLSTT